jgi:hypothetical protein
VMRFSDLAEVQMRGHELSDILHDWCEWKDRNH